MKKKKKKKSKIIVGFRGCLITGFEYIHEGEKKIGILRKRYLIRPSPLSYNFKINNLN